MREGIHSAVGDQVRVYYAVEEHRIDGVVEVGVHVVVEPVFLGGLLEGGYWGKGRRGGSPSCSVGLVIDVVASEAALFERY